METFLRNSFKNYFIECLLSTMGRIVIVSALWECPAPWGGRKSSSHDLRLLLLVVSVEQERTCIKTKYPML